MYIESFEAPAGREIAQTRKGASQRLSRMICSLLVGNANALLQVQLGSPPADQMTRKVDLGKWAVNGGSGRLLQARTAPL